MSVGGGLGSSMVGDLEDLVDFEGKVSQYEHRKQLKSYKIKQLDTEVDLRNYEYDLGHIKTAAN